MGSCSSFHAGARARGEDERRRVYKPENAGVGGRGGAGRRSSACAPPSPESQWPGRPGRQRRRRCGGDSKCGPEVGRGSGSRPAIQAPGRRLSPRAWRPPPWAFPRTAPGVLRTPARPPPAGCLPLCPPVPLPKVPCTSYLLPSPSFHSSLTFAPSGSLSSFTRRFSSLLPVDFLRLDLTAWMWGS